MFTVLRSGVAHVKRIIVTFKITEMCYQINHIIAPKNRVCSFVIEDIVRVPGLFAKIVNFYV